MENCALGSACAILDGGSSDGTVALAREAGGEAIDIVSRSDNGMYDALGSALPEQRADVVAWLNAGEAYDPSAFEVIAEVLAKFPEIGWLTGRATVRNERLAKFDSKVPHPFHRRYFDCGMYGTALPSVMQEGTFWRPELHQHVDFDRMRRTRLAGDFYLWHSFAKRNDLYVVNAELGSFTFEPEQLSRREPGAYVAELKTLCRSPTWWERMAAHAKNRWQRKRIPSRRARRLVSYDIKKRAWIMKRG